MNVYVILANTKINRKGWVCVISLYVVTPLRELNYV